MSTGHLDGPSVYAGIKRIVPQSVSVTKKNVSADRKDVMAIAIGYEQQALRYLEWRPGHQV
jgi:hypothetical protein